MIDFKNLHPYYSILPMIPGVQFFTNNSKLDSISKIQRGHYVDTGAFAVDYSPSTFYEPVPLDFYVKFSFFSYFMAFIGILFLQGFAICIIDIFWLKTMPSNTSIHSYFFLHIERSIWCFADMVTIFERFRECSKIVQLMVSQSSMLFSWLNFCKLAHTSTTEKSLENAAVLLQ